AAYVRETGISEGAVYLILGDPEPVGLFDALASGRAMELRIDFALLNFKDVELAGGGDINGDGYDDIAIGLKGVEGFRGEVYLIYGGEEIFSSNDLREVAQERGAVITGARGYDSLAPVAMVGDFNGDGMGDLLVGAPGSHGPLADEPGDVYVVFGARDFPSRIDLGCIGNRGIHIRGTVGSGGAGFRVAGAGDVDGDGTDDLLFAENGVHAEGVLTRLGNAYVVRSAYGAPGFRRGDANVDRRVDLSDAVLTLGYLFLGNSRPDCLDAADVDDSGDLTISDAIRLLGFLFQSAPPPPAPGAHGCGADPTNDPLGCDFYSCLE
ncbi:MAG TPA: hypothetical protein VK116_18290, partial [Planctomycetota bacterium]|nr:hypothetical protein [Planctomycetota bacterium]